MLRKMSVGLLVAALSLASIVACSESVAPNPDDVAGVAAGGVSIIATAGGFSDDVTIYVTDAMNQ